MNKLFKEKWRENRNHIITFVIAVIGIAWWFGLFTSGDEGNVADPNESTSRKTNQVHRTSTAIPKDVSYTIINTDIMPRMKRSLDIRLNRRVSENVLRSIALKLKKKDKKQYKRTFICYYLPGMTVGAGAWATTHFNPNLQVQILGLSSKLESEIKKSTQDYSGKSLGRWIDHGIAGGVITIYRQEDELFLEQIFNDKSKLREELIKRASKYGVCFDIKEGSPTGDYYLINKAGDLEIRDDAGLISTAKKIK